MKFAMSCLDMEPDYLLTEVILMHPRQSLGKIKLDWIPQPGNYLDVKGKTYGATRLA